ncbi:MAG: acylphosphatase, partial [Gammaproteobacteria bacterium]|nr:acylphosphatase [Gammaproteobacteria bacterium]
MPGNDARIRDARQWTLTGQVQGVGFRPFVYRLAHAQGLAGWVRNRLGEVEIHAEGDCAALDRFAIALIQNAPPLARPHIERTLSVEPTGLRGFEIRDSATTDKPSIHVP